MTRTTWNRRLLTEVQEDEPCRDEVNSGKLGGSIVADYVGDVRQAGQNDAG
jgi:hypothetical protein